MSLPPYKTHLRYAHYKSTMMTIAIRSYTIAVVPCQNKIILENFSVLL